MNFGLYVQAQAKKFPITL